MFLQLLQVYIAWSSSSWLVLLTLLCNFSSHLWIFVCMSRTDRQRALSAFTLLYELCGLCASSRADCFQCKVSLLSALCQRIWCLCIQSFLESSALGSMSAPVVPAMYLQGGGLRVVFWCQVYGLCWNQGAYNRFHLNLKASSGYWNLQCMFTPSSIATIWVDKNLEDVHFFPDEGII